MKRLLAAVAPLLLLAVALAGSAAHACEHARSVSQFAQRGPTSPDAATFTIASPVANSIAERRDALPEHQPGSGPCCCKDCICHGGAAAVLAAGDGWRFASWPRAASPPLEVQALASVSPTRLDRPPKSLVSA